MNLGGEHIMMHEVSSDGSAWMVAEMGLMNMVSQTHDEKAVEDHVEKKQLWKGQNGSALLPLGSFSHHYVEDEAYSIPHHWAKIVIQYL